MKVSVLFAAILCEISGGGHAILLGYWHRNYSDKFSKCFRGRPKRHIRPGGKAWTGFTPPTELDTEHLPAIPINAPELPTSQRGARLASKANFAQSRGW
jgi:hypothetical protein